jgi:NAD(P)-dependent dehydrogenase (short-subunit alcohol dehydrogenase family)
MRLVSCLVQIALITGGDSGIGRAAALMFAREGADLAISYLNEDRDAEVRVHVASPACTTVCLSSVCNASRPLKMQPCRCLGAAWPTLYCNLGQNGPAHCRW